MNLYIPDIGPTGAKISYTYMFWMFIYLFIILFVLEVGSLDGSGWMVGLDWIGSGWSWVG